MEKLTKFTTKQEKKNKCRENPKHSQKQIKKTKVQKITKKSHVQGTGPDQGQKAQEAAQG